MAIAFTLAVWTLIAALVLYGLRLLSLLEAADDAAEATPQPSGQLTLPAVTAEPARALVGAGAAGDRIT